MAQTPKPKNFKKPGNKRSNIVTIVVFVAIAIFFMTMISRMTAPANGISQTDQLVTSEFMQAVDQGRVQTVVYDSGAETISGTYYPASTAGSEALSAFNTGIEALNSQLGVMTNGGSRLGIVSVQDLSTSTLGTQHNYTCTWVGQDSLGELMAAHPEISYRVNLASPWGSILLSLLPILLIAGILFFFFSQMNKANNSQMSFGKAKAKKSCLLYTSDAADD